jgi:Holliday junction resolvasome RuvABC endonuclease subunit
MLTMLGIDPGFAACGHAEVEVDQHLHVNVLRLGVITTSKSHKKQRVLACDDQTRRLRELSSLLGMMIGDAGVVCSEALSDGHGNAATSKLVGMMWGVVVAHSQTHSRPILQVTPADMRKRLGLSGKAGKSDIKKAMQKRYGEAKLEELLSGVAEGKRVHAYDALAAIVACLDSDQVRLALAMNGAVRNLADR